MQSPTLVQSVMDHYNVGEMEAREFLEAPGDLPFVFTSGDYHVPSTFNVQQN